MDHDETSQDTTEDEIPDESWMRRVPSIAAVLTSEAELRAWYLAVSPTLREMGLSCPRKRYREMQRDLRDFDAIISIIPATGENVYE